MAPQLPSQSAAPSDHQHHRAMPGSVGADALQADSVTSTAIAAGAVGSSEIATDAVGSDEIAAGAVGSSEIATDAVGSDEIAANAVGTAEIADDAVTDAKIEDSFARGIIARFSSNANATGLTADGVTDMVLTNVPVVINHWYALHLKTRVDLSTAAGSLWHLQLRVNGTQVDTFATLDRNAGDPTREVIDATCYWQAPATASTDDFDVFGDEVSGTETLTLVGVATAGTIQLRTLTITDMGVI